MARCNLKLVWGCLLLFVGVSSVSAGGCAYQGSSDVSIFLPHNKYCNLFYRLDKCPNGLVYNPRRQQCDFPKNTNCGYKKILNGGDIDEGNTPWGPGDGPIDGSGEGEYYPDTTEKPVSVGGHSFIGGICPSSKPCPKNVHPHQEVFIPHSTSCNLFCSCVKGTPFLYQCQLGFRFNPRTSRCEYANTPECSFDDGVISSTVFPPISGIEIWRRPIHIEGECRPKGKCPSSGESLLPHETDCNLLCGCKNGKAVLYRCPIGLHYNAMSKKCDHQKDSGCYSSSGRGETETGSYDLIPKPKNPNIGTLLEGTCLSARMCPLTIPSGFTVYLPHLTVCNLFCECNWEALKLYACPKGLHFNPKTQECDSPNNAGCNPIPPHKVNPILTPNITGNGDCSTVQACPAKDPSDFTIYLPHLTDCGYFCRCDHGMPKLDKCAQGLHFNPKKQSCDVPNNAICITTSAVETVNPTMKPGEVGKDKNDTAGTGVQQELCPAEGTCPAGKSDYLPHQRSCTFFCECVSGIPRLRECSKGLHFNPKNKKCEAPNKALCQGECNKLERREATTWSPDTCVSRLSKIGDVCKIKCAKGFELRGSALVTCTKQGWSGSAGINNMPSCKAPEEVGKDIIDNVDQQAKGKVNFLFILDESLSLSEEEFDSELSFIKAIVSQFPLSTNRTAGVITFSGSAAVDIHMTHTDTCKFFEATKKIEYTGGSTDIRLALRTALQELATYSPKTRTLVFLVTDGKSETNPTVPANHIKNRGDVLFAIGVGQYDRKELEPLASLGNDKVPLFFGITNFKAFNKIAEYLHTVHGYGVNLNCGTI